MKSDLFRYALLTALMLLMANNIAAAQTRDRTTYRSYVTPFPPGNVYELTVLGDGLGDGVSRALATTFAASGNVAVRSLAGWSVGFARQDAYRPGTKAGFAFEQARPQIAVVVMGINDGEAIKGKRRWFKVGGDPEWRDIYGARIDRFLKRLKSGRKAIYWVGLPVMRKPGFNARMQLLNDLYREKAYFNGIKFIDSWNAFTDQNNKFNIFGPDIEGRNSRLRAKDGILFTKAGYAKLARLVEQEIRRDLAAARAERNVPLAGDEAEQRRAVPGLVVYREAGPAAEKKKKKKLRKGISGIVKRRALPSLNTVTGAAPAAQGSTPADTILRVSGGLAFGQTISSELGNGLTALSSISPANELSDKGFRHTLPLRERPFYRVLINGERIAPKVGRSDDFKWPGG